MFMSDDDVERKRNNHNKLTRQVHMHSYYICLTATNGDEQREKKDEREKGKLNHMNREKGHTEASFIEESKYIDELMSDR
jgi:hypothetical protein